MECLIICVDRNFLCLLKEGGRRSLPENGFHVSAVHIEWPTTLNNAQSRHSKYDQCCSMQHI